MTREQSAIAGIKKAKRDMRKSGFRNDLEETLRKVYKCKTESCIQDGPAIQPGDIEVHQLKF